MCYLTSTSAGVRRCSFVSFVCWFWILPLSISWGILVELADENIARVGWKSLKEVGMSRALVLMSPTAMLWHPGYGHAQAEPMASIVKMFYDPSISLSFYLCEDA